MAKIQELLKGRDDRIDYDEIKLRFPWIIQRDQKCIISPDSDGLLCGLLMSHMLDWKVKGFYDGKVMVLENGVSASECIFLDMDVFRRNMKSVGHHMVLYNKNTIPENWGNYDNCIQPNNLREYDCLHDFRLKYPLATVHLLIGILGSGLQIEIPESAICPLLFTDGTFNVLFSYPENVLNWLRYLRADEGQNPLKTIFENEKYSVFKLMQAMDEFFRSRDEISIPNERGDRLRISNTDGTPSNIERVANSYIINNDAVTRIVRFIQMMGTLTGWKYKPESWVWSNLALHRFTKGSFENDKNSINGPNIRAFLQTNPLSWAITSRLNLEYTLEQPDTMT